MSRRVASSHAGFALLEVMVALVILGLAGMAVVEVAETGVRSIADARMAEERLYDMDRLLRAHTLLHRRDLGRRVGPRVVGRYTLTIDRMDLEMFRMAVGLAGEQPELHTVVYRPGAGDE